MLDVKHEVLQDVKRVAVELGRAPTRDEYLKLGKHGRKLLDRLFGSFTTLLSSCGLSPDGRGQRRRVKEKYTPIEPVLEHYRNNGKQSIISHPKLPILIIGDTHFPFVHLDALSWMYVMVEKYQPSIVVQVGDLSDCYAQSKFPRSHNTYSPKEETDLAFEMAADMWRKVKNIVPNAKCYQLHGNHSVRAYKRILEVAPSLEHLLDFDKYLTFDGVELIKDPREELVIGDVVFTHGWLSQLGAHRDHLMRNVCLGHSHVGGVSFKNIGGKTLYELNAGYLGDPMSKALSYTATRTTRWTHGIGLIDTDGPRFIPCP